MIERPPRLELSADGAVVLIDDRQWHLSLYSLPVGELLINIETDPYVYITSLSATGTVVATMGERGWLGTGGPEIPLTRHQVPPAAGRVHSLQVSDDGAAILFLCEHDTEPYWKIEKWSIPFGHGPIASISLKRPKRPRMLADGELDQVAFWDDHEMGQTILLYQSGTNSFEVCWQEDLRPAAALLNREWAWFVLADGLHGWRRSGDQRRLPGKLRERLVFSQQEHLLSYGGVATDKPLDPNETMMAFRLFNLAAGVELDRLQRPVISSSQARFMVSDDGALYEIRADEEGKLQVEPLGAFKL